VKGPRLTHDEIQDAKSRDLVALVGVHVKLKRRGNQFWGCCPFHKEKSPSFKVENGRFHCFGCGKDGDAIQWVREAEHLDFEEAVRRLSRSTAPVRFAGIIANPAPARYNEASDIRYAKRIWDGAVELKGTPAEAYLRARKIRGPLSPELRFHPACYYSETKETWPAMVARLVDKDGFRSVQRTYLDREAPRKAPLEHAKKTGRGRMEGAAVRLREPTTGILGLAEGIETAMSAAMLYQLPVWATLSSQRLGLIDVPEGVSNLVIFADGGKPGQDAAYQAQELYEAAGLFVEVVLPGADFSPEHGDFNDAAQARP
jgi:DNA primase